MIDAVLSFHSNPLTCGVVKFDQALAKRMNVRWSAFDQQTKRLFRRPLISVKTAEWIDWDGDIPSAMNSYELFFHDAPGRAPREREVIARAWRVYAANTTIAEALRPFRPDVIDAFCPSTVDGRGGRGRYRVLTFGMSHKLNLPHFEALKVTLEASQPDYTIELSTAVHEGNPWDTALTESVDAMRTIFGNKLRVLGFLGDDALAKELRDVDAVAVFYQPALRANNTSYWAAVDAGKTIYTNRDEFSPQEGAPPASWPALVALIEGGA